MQAILLAGGLGTRLREVVVDRPKPMALIKGKPFIEYVIHELMAYGITDIVFAIGYKGAVIEEYFGDGSEFGITVHYAYEEELLGTAGAIKHAGAYVTEDEFLVLNADTFYQIDYVQLFRLKKERSMDMALVLREVSDVSRYGRVVLEDQMLTAFNEKSSKPKPGYINGGIYLMNRNLLSEIPDGKVSLENQMMPLWLKQSKRLGGMVAEGYFIDIGIPEDYHQFIHDVEKGVVKW